MGRNDFHSFQWKLRSEVLQLETITKGCSKDKLLVLVKLLPVKSYHGRVCCVLMHDVSSLYLQAHFPLTEMKYSHHTYSASFFHTCLLLSLPDLAVFLLLSFLLTMEIIKNNFYTSVFIMFQISVY